MPNEARTHNDNRSYVCFICRKKPVNARLGTNIWVIRNKLLELVREHFLGSYDPDDQKCVDGLCGSCRSKLIRIEAKKLPASALGTPFDQSQLEFPTTDMAELEGMVNCPCANCSIANSYCGSAGNTFGSRRPTSTGRPIKSANSPVPESETSQQTISPPEIESSTPNSETPQSPDNDTITICRKCLTEKRRGISHQCNITTRRENMEKLQSEDPKGAEIAASKIVKQKMATAKGEGSSTFSLQSGGSKPMNLPIPSPSKNVQAKYADPNTPIPAEQLSRLKVNANLSMNQTREVEKWVRANTGRKSVESGATEKVREDLKSLEPFFTWEHHFFDSSKAAERVDGKKVIRPIVYCHELQKLINHLREKRGFHSMTKHMIKLGADGGKQFLKFCINLIKEVNETESSPVQRKARSSYAKGSFSIRYKGSGVKLSIIIAIVQDVSESPDNLEVIWNLTRLNFIMYVPATDLKFTLSGVGMGSASSKYPCPFCTMPSCDFMRHFGESGELRTFADIKSNALQYQNAAAKSKSKVKLSSQDYLSCERFPLMKPNELPDTTFVLDFVPPPELHILLGITLELYKGLEKELEQNGSPVSALDWAKSVNAEPTAYHGGAFIGPHCIRLLEGTKKLYELLKSNNALSIGGRFGHALATFNEVRKACFGTVLHKDYKHAMEEFKEAYLKTGLQSQAIKTHICVGHVIQFLDRKKDSHPGKGLGHWSEQATETIHSDFDNMYVGSKYIRPLNHPEYADKLFACVVTYDSSHVGDEFCD